MNLALLIISFFWLATEIAVVGFRRSKPSDQKHDRSSLFIIWIVIFLAISGGIMLQEQEIGRIRVGGEPMRVGGIALIALGLILRWVAILSLKTRFTVDVAITEGHRVITHGIYGIIRHPAYAGTLLSFFGFGLYLANLLSLLAVVLPICAVFLYRIRIEEAALREAFGEEYARYSRRTKRLLPGVY
jgi:protein-S-isoprenylcysteine O-methyltransferase Ste14